VTAIHNNSMSSSCLWLSGTECEGCGWVQPVEAPTSPARSPGIARRASSSVAVLTIQPSDVSAAALAAFAVGPAGEESQAPSMSALGAQPFHTSSTGGEGHAPPRRRPWWARAWRRLTRPIQYVTDARARERETERQRDRASERASEL
jgi:hypothetical protein